MADAVLEHWDEGAGLNESQINPLGVKVPDPDDGAWIYGRFVGNGTYNFGVPVRHAEAAELQGAAAGGTVTTAAAIGNNRLIDTGAFTDRDVEGAYGYIYEGTGAGQHFWVVKRLDNDTLLIACLTGATAPQRKLNGGWVEATGTDSKYRLWLPGYFHLSAVATGMNAGVYQGEALTVTDGYKPYGWVRCEGLGFGLIDYDGSATRNKGYVIPGTGNLLINTTSAENAVGKILMADGLTANGVAPIQCNFPYWGISRRNVPAGSRHAYNRVDVGV